MRHRLIINIFLALIIFASQVNFSFAQKWKGKKKIKNGVIFMLNTEKGLWRNKKNIKMESVLTIGIEDGDEDYILAKPKSIVSDKNNNIYICDYGDHCVKVYDTNGKFLRRIGNKGEGPMEFIDPKYIAINNQNQLCVLSRRRKMNYFTLEGEFIDSFTSTNDFIYRNFTPVPWNDNILITRELFPYEPMAKENKYTFFELNPKGNIVNRYGALVHAATSNQGDIYMDALITLNNNDKLFLLYQHKYRIDIYDKDIKHKMTITRQFDLFSENQIIDYKGWELFETRTVMMYPLAVLPNNKIIVPILDRGKKYIEKFRKRDPSAKIFYDLYDQEGRFLQSFYWKENWEEIIVYIDMNGFVYTISGPDEIPRVRKYKIFFE